MSAIRQQPKAKPFRGMCVVGEYTPEEILALIGDRDELFYAGDFPYSVHMDSLRYITFAKSLVCVSCGLRGIVMRLEYSWHQKGQFRPHFNLYALNPDNGTFVLMTKDHIIPKAKGGKDDESNLQTMCLPCNAKKADKHEAGTETQLVQRSGDHQAKGKVRPKVVLDNFHCHFNSDAHLHIPLTPKPVGNKIFL